MNKEVRVFILATLVGAATGATACAVFAHCIFAAHVLAASIVGGLIGALAGDSGRSLFEAAIICLIAGVLIALLVVGSRGGKTPNVAYELPVLLCASALLGGATGRLAARLRRCDERRSHRAEPFGAADAGFALQSSIRAAVVPHR